MLDRSLLNNAGKIEMQKTFSECIAMGHKNRKDKKRDSAIKIGILSDRPSDEEKSGNSSSELRSNSPPVYIQNSSSN